MAEKCYRCENEFGVDPCLYAKENRLIRESEAGLALAEEQHPKCPGKTESGQPCGSELVSVRCPSNGLGLPLPIIVGAVAAGVVLISLLIFWLSGSGAPVMQVMPESMVLTANGNTTVRGAVTIRNTGDGDLVIEKIEAMPAIFTPSASRLDIAPGDEQRLSVEFVSPSKEMEEGVLLLHTNVSEDPVRVPLVANQNPWWVYDGLDQSSRVLK